MRFPSVLLAATLLATGPAGAADSNSITVGFTVSRTGALNVDSVPQLNGIELWAEQVNAAGGIKAGGKSYQVKLASYDDQSIPARVQQLYSQLILSDRADFLISPYSSGLTATAVIVSEQHGKIMLTTGAAEEKTYQLGNRHLFQMYTPADQYLVGPLDLLKAKNPSARIALLYSDDAFSKAVAVAAREHARKLGFSVVLDEAYSPNTTDFGPIIRKIAAANADALIGGGHYADGSTLARQLHEQRVDLKFVSLLVAPDSPQFAGLGDAAVDITVPSQWEPEVTFKPDYGPTPQAFTAAYKAKYSELPGYHAAGGYAAGLILQHAIEQAGSIETDNVAQALDATKLTTFFGDTRFATDKSQHGLQIGHTMVVAQWQRKNGTLVKEVVWPEKAVTTKLEYPAK
jgi:branched-chain amino acid transport system substrate-binding protein